MMQSPKKTARWLLVQATLVAATPFALIAQDSTAPAEATGVAPEVMEAMGFAMARSLQLNIGFSEEELESIFAGMRNAAAGEEPTEAMNAVLPAAQQYYMQKRQAYMESLEAEKEAAYEANIAEGAAFLAALEGVATTESGLRYEIIEKGDGAAVTIGNEIDLNYTGALIDGTVFDSGEGVTFPLRASGGLIEGFREGLQLLNVGGKIKLYIPADLGYGRDPRPGGAIEPGDALVFDIEVLEMRALPAPKAPQMPGRPGSPAGGPPSGPPPGPPPNMTPPPPPSTPPPSLPPSTAGQ